MKPCVGAQRLTCAFSPGQALPGSSIAYVSTAHHRTLPVPLNTMSVPHIQYICVVPDALCQSQASHTPVPHTLCLYGTFSYQHTLYQYCASHSQHRKLLRCEIKHNKPHPGTICPGRLNLISQFGRKLHSALKTVNVVLNVL
eukprot:3940826-Rhodomonas_salina.1